VLNFRVGAALGLYIFALPLLTCNTVDWTRWHH